MDGDFWASKVYSSKHHSCYLSSGNTIVLDDDSGLNEVAMNYLTCPFCYVDIELCMLCDHLQEKHCFDVKNAVCPLCALNLGRDVVSHFKTQHMSAIKTRRKSQKSGLWTFYAGRIQGGLSSENGIENEDDFAPDPLLSPFLYRMLTTECMIDHSQDLCSNDDCSFIQETVSLKSPRLSKTEEKEDFEELSHRAEFCQQIFCSTIV